MTRIDQVAFRVADTETLVPDDDRAGDFFSRIGYTMADAVADLVDNSIDAGAPSVLIRFVRDSSGVTRVLIADDGEGMTEKQHQESMRFGSRSKKSAKQLGKYGIGLKTASLSQAEAVTVLTRRGGATLGRRWSIENVKANWTCEILEPAGVSAALSGQFAQLDLRRSGTVVIWERLAHLQSQPETLDEVLARIKQEISVELGIRFHRFIESGRLSIQIDEQFAGEEEPEVHQSVFALNPFGYAASGNADYPITLKFIVDGVGVSARCHVWPPKTSSPNYRLGGGRVASRQGFYFYRNDRVIQAGGWNRLRGDDSEPHFSLARVEIDLPPILDSLFRLDISKSRLEPTPKFIAGLRTANSHGVTFATYLEQAEATYRKQKKKEAAKFPFVPHGGFSVAARNAIHSILSEKGTGRPKKIDFKWATLDFDQVFAIDSKSERILLNTRYRKKISEGGTADAPLFKLTLLFLLQRTLEKSFQTRKSEEWQQRINQALIASLKGM